MTGELDDVVREFLLESYENLDRLDRDLVVLESDPASRQTLASVFRTIHTIKGTCGFLGFSRLEAVAHSGESLLARLRDGKLALTPEITTGLLAMVDAVRELLGHIEEHDDEGTGDYTALIGTLRGLQEPAPAPVPGPADPATPAAEVDPEADQAGQEAVPSGREESRGGGVSDSTIRVDVALLDRLMDLVGELVLARNQLLRLTSAEQATTLAAASQRLNLVTTELQEGIMKARMQPIGNLWGKLPRIVRDLALACGKQVTIEMDGGETELDKTVVEAIRDPLTHLVRNAVDHGIEAPAARLAAGKPAEGRVGLRAWHEGGQVNLEISDDGSGIDVERVRRRAVDHGLVGREVAERMSERDAVDLIFLPGFSTADQVTNVSGRGVGMDVVRTNVERIGGRVDVRVLPGAGTTFRIEIPLTLAIIPALVVACAGHRYAIPQASLVELVRLEDGAGVETVHGAPVHRLRGRLLPLVHLRQQLGLPEPDAGPGSMDVVVLQAGDRRFGLVVDRVDDTEEIVVKPLSSGLKGVGVLAGATIMGDGTVALILDVVGVAQRAGVVQEAHERPSSEPAAGTAAPGGGQRRDLLVFQTPDDGRMAVPLPMVDRLEELPVAAVELAGQEEVVQYRGDILPLVRVSATLPERRGRPRHDGDQRPEGTIQVVVCTAEGRKVGLVVDRIVDIVEEHAGEQAPGSRPGSSGCIVLDGRVTELLDVEALLRGQPGPAAPALPVPVEEGVHP